MCNVLGYKRMDKIINSAVIGACGAAVVCLFKLIFEAVINYIQKRAEKKNTYNTVSDTNVEQASPTNANEVNDVNDVNDVSKQPQEQTSDKQQDVLTDVEVGIGEDNAVNVQAEQIQSADENTIPQNSLSKEEKEFFTNVKDIIGVDLSKSDNLDDTINDIDDWANNQQPLIENYAYDEKELSAYNEIALSTNEVLSLLRYTTYC